MKDNEQDHDRVYFLHEFLIELLYPPLLPFIFLDIFISAAAAGLALLYPQTLADISLKYGFGLWNTGQNAYEYVYRRFGGDGALLYLALGALAVPSLIMSSLLSIPVFSKLYKIANHFLNDGRAIIFTLISAAIFFFPFCRLLIRYVLPGRLAATNMTFWCAFFCGG